MRSRISDARLSTLAASVGKEGHIFARELIMVYPDSPQWLCRGRASGGNSERPSSGRSSWWPGACHHPARVPGMLWLPSVLLCQRAVSEATLQGAHARGGGGRSGHVAAPIAHQRDALAKGRVCVAKEGDWRLRGEELLGVLAEEVRDGRVELQLEDGRAKVAGADVRPGRSTSRHGLAALATLSCA